MKTRRTVAWVMGLAAMAIMVFLGCCCLVAVDETEYAVVTSFGKIVALHGVGPAGRDCTTRARGRACCGSIIGCVRSIRRHAR